MPSIVWVHLTRFHTCAVAHEMAGGWSLQTSKPFLRYLPDVSCNPKSMAGNPRHNIGIAIFTQIYSVVGIGVQSIFVPVNFWSGCGHFVKMQGTGNCFQLSTPKVSSEVNWT